MAKLTKIGLVVGTDVETHRQVYRGVMSFARAHGRWAFYPMEPLVRQAKGLRQWGPEGMIALMNRADIFQSILTLAHSLRIPLVGVLYRRKVPGMPNVLMDETATGVMAAHHFLERGFSHLGYLHWQRARWSELRRDGFIQAVKEAGRGNPCLQFDARMYMYRQVTNQTALRRWVSELPKPIGIFAACDLLGFALAEACREQEIAVPGQVAILGVDNDERWCNLSYPTLSSIIPAGERVGYEAALVLAGMLEGRPGPTSPILVPPRGILVRASSDIVANEDPDLAAAMRFINASVGKNIGVNDVLEQVPISRRSLEMKFKKALGRSPLEEIHRVRIEQAKNLLSRGQDSILAIAAQCGFKGSNRFIETFRRYAGMTPLAYRKRFHLR